jgi:hypothetical protein
LIIFWPPWSTTIGPFGRNPISRYAARLESPVDLIFLLKQNYSFLINKIKYYGGGLLKSMKTSFLKKIRCISHILLIEKMIKQTGGIITLYVCIQI